MCGRGHQECFKGPREPLQRPSERFQKPFADAFREHLRGRSCRKVKELVEFLRVFYRGRENSRDCFYAALKSSEFFQNTIYRH